MILMDDHTSGSQLMLHVVIVCVTKVVGLCNTASNLKYNVLDTHVFLTRPATKLLVDGIATQVACDARRLLPAQLLIVETI